MVAGLLSRKADAFAALLDGESAGNATDPALAHLANLTQRLSALPGPAAPFRAALRDQLVSSAAAPASVAAPTAAAPATSLLQGHAAGGGATAGSASSTASGLAALGKSAPLWIKLFTGTMALAVSATGVGIGAHRALPGDLFYGVKRQVEAVQLDLAGSSREKADTQLGFAHARIDELAALIRREGITPKSNISSETAGHIRGLLEDWAEEAGVATTSLITQIRSLGSATSTAALSAQLRRTLQLFTSQQFSQLGALLANLPAGPLQSLTVSALGYLQRVDQVLGGDPTALAKQLPIPLSAIPGLADVAPQLNLPTGNGAPGTGGATPPSPTKPTGPISPKAPKGSLPTNPPKLPLPTTLPTLPTTGTGGVKLPVPKGGVVPSTGVGGSLGNKVGGALGGNKPLGAGTAGNASNASNTVTGTVGTAAGAVGTVTGGLSSSSGPALSLPSSLPTLPPLPKLP